MSEIVRDPIAARARIERAAEGLPVTGGQVPEDQRDAAAQLLADLYAAAAAHGVTADDLGAVTSLPMAALDVVRARARAR